MAGFSKTGNADLLKDILVTLPDSEVFNINGHCRDLPQAIKQLVYTPLKEMIAELDFEKLEKGPCDKQEYCIYTTDDKSKSFAAMFFKETFMVFLMIDIVNSDLTKHERKCIVFHLPYNHIDLVRPLDEKNN